MFNGYMRSAEPNKGLKPIQLHKKNSSNLTFGSGIRRIGSNYSRSIRSGNSDHTHMLKVEGSCSEFDDFSQHSGNTEFFHVGLEKTASKAESEHYAEVIVEQ
jgi:hypothetical protein